MEFLFLLISTAWRWLLDLGERGEVGDEEEGEGEGGEGEAGEGEGEGEGEGAEASGAGEEEGEGAGEGEGEGEGARTDPTADMSSEEKLEYWEKRARHFEGDYKKERTKRQSYQKQFGSLGDLGKGGDNGKRGGKEEPVTDLSGVKTLGQFASYMRGQLRSEMQEELSEKDKKDRMLSSESRARESYDGSDGLPAYDEMIDEQVAPLIKKNPNIYNLLREMPDPANAAYTLGFLLKFPNFKDMLKGEGREELIKNIKKNAKKAVTLQGGKEKKGGGKLSAEEIMNMDDDEFEKEIAKAKGIG